MGQDRQSRNKETRKGTLWRRPFEHERGEMTIDKGSRPPLVSVGKNRGYEYRIRSSGSDYNRISSAGVLKSPGKWRSPREGGTVRDSVKFYKRRWPWARPAIEGQSRALTMLGGEFAQPDSFRACASICIFLRFGPSTRHPMLSVCYLP